MYVCICVNTTCIHTTPSVLHMCVSIVDKIKLRSLAFDHVHTHTHTHTHTQVLLVVK